MVLSSNPFPQTVSVSFAIIKAAIESVAHEQFEKKFVADVSSVFKLHPSRN